MQREAQLEAVRTHDGYWDVVVVGGGATGLGVAVESAARGYTTLLLEAHDFAKGTSSRSTKLVHGGVRYLQQGNVALVLEALRERGRLLRNAPHLVHELKFVVPTYDWWEGPFYGVGLKLYDVLAGRLGLTRSRVLSRSEALERLPTVEPEGLRGGVVYSDAQFDDARLAVTLARTAVDAGATVLNYAPVVRLSKHEGLVCGVVLRDEETGREHQAMARVVVNATGVFADEVRRLDEPEAARLLAPSQGVHLVLDRSFLPGDTAVMVPHTDDGRVLFALPWSGRVVVGTTDTAVDEVKLEPRALPEEVDYLLGHAGRYLTKDPGPADVLSLFAGLRPLVRADEAADTASLSRDHTVAISSSGLVTVTGGKWTTYRKMAEDALDRAAVVAGLEERPSTTAGRRLHGWLKHPGEPPPLDVYGSDGPAVRRVLASRRGWGERLHERLPYLVGEVAWAARHEMARTVEDVLARRTRALLLDARAAAECAPTVAAVLARELRRGRSWQKRQVEAFRELAAGYVLPG